MPIDFAQRRDDHVDAPLDVVAGDLVRVREGVWRVMEVRTFARSPPMRARVLKLIGADALNRWQPCTLLEPFDRPRRVESVRAPRVVSRARWMRTCAALVAASPPAGCPATIADAQVTLMPHQIDPVLAVLRGRASRLLLADAVGLGKTIQAALLVRELRARGCADRVLVLVPSGLREQWRQELSHRTGLRADIIDAAALAARMRDLPPDVNPWSLPGILIVSLDFIKQPSVLHGASTIVWDILIADEAHNLNEGTDRLAAADLLARHSRHVVLLTATPHHGSDDAFAALCRIGGIGRIGRIGVDAHAAVGAAGSEADADPIAIFRRTRQTMGLTRTRKVHVLRVTPTKQERRLHTLLARYAGRVEREPGGASDSSNSMMSGRDAASLAMTILLKRASSSAWSLERSLRRRLALLDNRTLTVGDGAALQPHVQPVLPFGGNGRSGGSGVHGDDGDGSDGYSEDDVAVLEPSEVLGTPGLRSARIERAWLTLLIEASRNASRAESKPRALARFLRRCREPALIYTEYRDTLTHLARTLAGGGTASQAMLHGGLGADDRRAALARFTSGDARILLTTDAAGEGLNLHHRCRLVINVELPWNPNRLEQRIGRVDRLGQTRTVHAIHLVASDTAEEPMLARLTGRIAQIAATLGDAPAVLRASREFASADADADADADVTREPGDLAAADGIADGSLSNNDSNNDNYSFSDSYRTVSTAAAVTAIQLQRLRAMRSRAWRIGRHRATGPPTSRGDPLLALDERVPLIAVVRRCEPRTQTHLATLSRLSGAHELGLPAPGLICVWRTRVERDGGEAHARAGPPSQVLTVMRVACDVPSFSSRKAVAAFVTETLERCGVRSRQLLDSELADARERLHAMDRARIERLARRDEAIASEMAAMLRARTAGDGAFQPLLFEDIAIEKTAMTTSVGANGEGSRRHTWTSGSLDAVGAPERVESTLVMALVLR